MALDQVLFNKLLQVEPPWAVRNIRVNEADRRVDVSIGVELPRSWFGLGRKAVGGETEKTWRHVNIGAYHCYVHVFMPKGVKLAKEPWAGDDDITFTRAMSKQVFVLLSEGVNYNGICTLLEVAFNDLWKFKFALDSGRAGVEQKGAKTPEAARPEMRAASAAPAGVATPDLPPQAADSESESVPDATDPVWQELAEGRFNLDIRVLSLKLLLTRMRSQMEVIHDSDVRLLKLRELHRYFLKNERMLGHELGQLRRS